MHGLCMLQDNAGSGRRCGLHDSATDDCAVLAEFNASAGGWCQRNSMPACIPALLELQGKLAAALKVIQDPVLERLNTMTEEFGTTAETYKYKIDESLSWMHSAVEAAVKENNRHPEVMAEFTKVHATLMRLETKPKRAAGIHRQVDGIRACVGRDAEVRPGDCGTAWTSTCKWYDQSKPSSKHRWRKLRHCCLWTRITTTCNTPA